MREQEMREQNGLGMLHVRHPGHGHTYVGLRLEQKRVQQGFQAMLHFGGDIDDEQTKIGGDKLVAAAAGV